MPTKTPVKRKTSKRPRKKKDQEDPVHAWRKEDKVNRETLEFIQAIDRYKRKTQKAFPSWTEVLDILRSLGYRKVKKK
ncbi:MAG: hypothetical protein ACYTG7_05405 [Planctomycetota bacterium]|jgi:hypothetical protein